MILIISAAMLRTSSLTNCVYNRCVVLPCQFFFFVLKYIWVVTVLMIRMNKSMIKQHLLLSTHTVCLINIDWKQCYMKCDEMIKSCADSSWVEWYVSRKEKNNIGKPLIDILYIMYCNSTRWNNTTWYCQTLWFIAMKVWLKLQNSSYSETESIQIFLCFSLFIVPVMILLVTLWLSCHCLTLCYLPSTVFDMCVQKFTNWLWRYS